MSKDEALEPLVRLQKRVEEIAKELKLDLSVFNLSYAKGEKDPMLQIVFAISADAVKDAATLEQEGIDAAFESLVSGFVEVDQDEEEDEDVADILNELKGWMDDDSES